MRREVDPIFVKPRLLPRTWGRADLGDWCAGAPRPRLPVGEVWTLHPHNITESGEPFGMRLKEAHRDILGDLGRAPPSLRLVCAGADVSPIYSDAPVALWRILEAPPGASIQATSAAASRKGARTWSCKADDVFCAADLAWLKLGAGVVALEARANFQPSNHPAQRAPFMRLEAPARTARSVLLRDAALSVELWRLPERSRLEPDGETCHVLMAMTDGVAVDGRALGKGEAVFIPADGRRTHLAGRVGAEVLVAYPDVVPTSIWRHAPDPDPVATALSRAAAERPNTIEAVASVAPRFATLARAA